MSNGDHNSSCKPGCNDSHDPMSSNSVDYWGGPDPEWRNYEPSPGAKKSCLASFSKVVTSKGVKQICCVSPGDQVLTLERSVKKFTTVILVQNHDPVDVLSILIENHDTPMLLTADHPIYTGKKFVVANHFKTGDCIYTHSGLSRVCGVEFFGSVRV